MKKLILAFVLVVAFALPALANPFVDVPLNHWAYDAVQSLAARGVVIGYPDGTFGGHRALTRYEFSMAIARAIGYMERYVDEAGLATLEDIAILERLIQEFANELRNLGLTVEDVRRVVGEHSQALQAMDARVAELEKYAEPLKITGEFTATYTAFMPIDEAAGKVEATFVDVTELNLAATINDYTTAGVQLVVEDTLGGDGTVVTAEDFYIEYQKDEWYVRVGDIKIDKLDLGLVLGDFDADDYDLEFEGFHVVYAPEDDDITWRALGTLNEFYSLRLEWEQIAFGVALLPESDLFFEEGVSDIVVSAYGWTDFDDSDVKLAVEGAYGVLSASYGVAAELSLRASDDVTITVEGQYLTAGFTPALPDGPSAFEVAEDELLVTVGADYGIAGDEPDDDLWTIGLEYAYGTSLVTPGLITTSELTGTITFVPADAVPDEKLEVEVTYDLLAASFVVSGEYLNYPLDVDDENNEAFLSAKGQYEGDTGRIMAWGRLEYGWIEEKTTLTLEGRYDSTGAAVWSALAELEWEMAENTALTLGYEFNTWNEDDEFIEDTAGTLEAELSVSF
ncbi:MAG TPA: S-layer homology domain-containing protein [Atribacteraceae bacterium]|nr:S-layer homology domain-containing protein [Atribacteraceae bacterium]